MENTYLPGTVGERIADLRTQNHLTLKQLASRIGVDPTTLSRIETGETKHIADDTLIALARVFHTTTDFLLRLTDDPGRKHFDVNELGLSVEAAQNLSSGLAEREVVSTLLEIKDFCQLTHMISVFFQDGVSQGVSAFNSLISSVSDMLTDVPSARKDALSLRIPPYQADLTRINEAFLHILKTIKNEIGNRAKATEGKTTEITRAIIGKTRLLQKTQRKPVTKDQICGVICNYVADTYGFEHGRLNAVKEKLLDVFNALTEDTQ